VNTPFPQLEEDLNRVNGGMTRMNYWKKLTIVTVVLYFIVAVTTFAATSWRTQSHPIILPRSAWGAPPPTRAIDPRGTGTRLIFHHAAGWIVPFVASALFCVGSFLVSVQLNQVIGQPFCGTLIFLIVALPFFALMLLGQYSNAEHGRIISTVLNLGFLHLGGVQSTYYRNIWSSATAQPLLCNNYDYCNAGNRTLPCGFYSAH